MVLISRNRSGGISMWNADIVLFTRGLVARARSKNTSGEPEAHTS